MNVAEISVGIWTVAYLGEIAWLLGLLVVASAAAALSTVVGAPVAVAGGLVVALVGRWLDLLEETAGYASEQGATLAAGILRWTAGVWPDFHAYDLSTHVIRRWDAPFGLVLGRLGPSAAAVAVLLGLAWLLLFARRR